MRYLSPALWLALALTALPVRADTLKIAAVVPEGSAWMEAMRAAAREIEQTTAGRVALKFYPGGVMGDGQAVLRKMRVGQLQGGAFTSGSLADLVPDAELYGLPFLFRSYAEVDYVRARMDARLRSDFERAGLIAITISEGGFAQLLSRQPVRALDDLRAKKVWAPEEDPMSRVAWEAAGIAPVPLPLADVFTGLQTGLVDAVTSPPVGAIAFQWHTSVQYMTDVPLSYVMGVVVLDARAFKKLEAADREVVLRVMDRISRELDARTREGDRQAREALLRQGIRLVQPSPEELTRWREIGSAALTRIQTSGHYSRERIGELQGHLAAYRASATGAPASAPAAPAP
jgi:TRAP-type C4-dicarboxylate transport system substrate-binding protein